MKHTCNRTGLTTNNKRVRLPSISSQFTRKTFQTVAILVVRIVSELNVYWKLKSILQWVSTVAKPNYIQQ